MTNEQAISVLKMVEAHGSLTIKAKEMAIKALEAQPCDDAISRSEAIRVASGYCHWSNIPEELAKLPSVNPKHCEDVISRQAVLDLAYDMSEIDGEHFTESQMVVDVEDIQKLPSVTPAQKMGRWIEVTDEETLTTRTWHYECSECGTHLKAVEKTRYCSECGALLLVDAKMEGVEETESCKGCKNICVMYDPDMKGCKDKMEGVKQ